MAHGALGPNLMDKDRCPSLQFSHGSEAHKLDEDICDVREIVIDQSQRASDLVHGDGLEGTIKTNERPKIIHIDLGTEEERLTQELELLETASVQSLNDKSDDESQQPWIKS